MITKSDIIKAAREHGFEDVGFTTADPFPDHKQLLLDRHKEYEWAETAGLKLLDGTDPTSILPDAKTIIVAGLGVHNHRFRETVVIQLVHVNQFDP